MASVAFERPEVGQAVYVRNRLATVRAVEPYDTRGKEGMLHLVDVEYLDDCRYPESEQILWEVDREIETSHQLNKLGQSSGTDIADLTRRARELLESTDDRMGISRLTLLHRRFAPQWLTLRCQGYVADNHEWKNWWAVNETDRLRLKIENEVIIAELYGLEPDDLNWMVRTDETNPIGFWRVEQSLPFIERITGLAACAFHSLKEGKWSAETVGELSNDEFFEMLGIPEMTSESAAHAKGIPGPLILKRGGCHSWHPEDFTPDDPRYGWTWEHCCQDAVALLGSEQAVDDYIRQAIADGDSGSDRDSWSKDDKEPEEEPFRLIAEPAKKRDQQPRFNFDD